jgi:hypothetical protein
MIKFNNELKNFKRIVTLFRMDNAGDNMKLSKKWREKEYNIEI